MNADRNPVGWFEIYVQDLDRAKSFYEKTFGVTLERLESPEVHCQWSIVVGPSTMDSYVCAASG